MDDIIRPSYLLQPLVGCPSDMMDQIGGCSSDKIDEVYGEGFKMSQLHAHLLMTDAFPTVFEFS